MLEQLATFMSLSLPNPEQSEPLRAVRREASVARQRTDEMVSHTTNNMQILPHTFLLNSHLNCPPLRHK